MDASDQEDLGPLEWIPGTITVSDEVPEIVRQAVKIAPCRNIHPRVKATGSSRGH